ncbi:MAG: hypothetical protein AAFU64_00675 [Bacteroidota bacterium]
MRHAILDRLSSFVHRFGGLMNKQRQHIPQAWEVPRQKHFFINKKELKMLSVALAHYKKSLRHQRAFDQMDQVVLLDERILHLIAFVEAKEGQKVVQ